MGVLSHSKAPGFDGGDEHGRASARLRRLWEQALELPDAAAKLGAILAEPRAGSLLRTVPAQDLFLLARQVGLADAAEMVALASPEQFRTFVDLAGWKREEPDPGEIAAWLRSLVLGRCEDIPSRVDKLDDALVGWTLLKLVRVHRIEPEQPLQVGKRIFFISSDRAFALEVLLPEMEDVARLLLRAKEARLGPLGLSIYLSYLCSELPSPLCSEAARWRTVRLEELGFPPYEEALTLYVPLPEHELRALHGPLARRTDTTLPRWLMRREAGPKLRGAVEELEPQLRLLVEQDLVHLTNALMVASSVDPGDEEEAVRVLSRARGYLEIALTLLGATDPRKGAALLRRISSRFLFRFTATGLHGLMMRARALSSLGPRLDPRDQAWLESLSLLPARRACGEEFQCPEDLGEADAVLKRIEDIQQVLRQDPCLAELPDQTSALSAFGTSLARRVQASQGGGGALRQEEARAFVDAAFRDGEMRSEVRKLARSWLGELLGDQLRGRLLADVWSDALSQDLGGIDTSAPIDPRFIAGLLLDQGPSGLEEEPG